MTDSGGSGLKAHAVRIALSEPVSMFVAKSAPECFSAVCITATVITWL
jgi:hypothetical protein